MRAQSTSTHFISRQKGEKGGSIEKITSTQIIVRSKTKDIIENNHNKFFLGQFELNMILTYLKIV